jgi:tetratricopeptide (TPR) repeat protein
MLKRVLLLCVTMLLVNTLPVCAQTMEEALMAYENEEYDKAQKGFEAYLATEPKDDEVAIYWLGMTYYERDAFAKAKEYFQKGLDEKSRSPLNNAGMGLMMMKETQYADAYTYLENAMDYSKGKDPVVAFAVADAYLKGSSAEIREAKKILYGRREDDPDDPRTYMALGKYYYASGTPSLAIEELEKVIILKPDYVPAYVFLAELYYEKGKESGQGEDYKKAFDYANKAIELKPKYPPSYQTRAEIYLLMKSFDKARDDMQKYVSLTEGDLRAELRYASFLFLTQDYQAAIDQLKSIDTTTNVKRRLLGLSYYELDQLDQAQGAMDDYFKNVKKEEYIIWQDYQVYGDILRAKGNIKEADEYYEKMIMKNGDRSVYFEDIADEYKAKAEAIEEEAKQFRPIAAKAQDSATYYYKQYNLAAESNDVEKANAAKARMDAAVALGKAAIQERDEFIANNPTAPIYSQEAHYRQKVVDYAEAESSKNAYNLAKALYNAERWEQADSAFIKVSELAETYLPPYNYRMQVAQKLENADTTSISWYTKSPAEALITVFGSKAPAELESGEKKLLLLAYEIMANYAFNPSGGQSPEAYNPEDAVPFIEKILAIDPDYSRINSLKDYAEQQLKIKIGPQDR